MARLAILIDGAYLERLATSTYDMRVDYATLSETVREIVAKDSRAPLDILRTYYYNALPYKGSRPTADENQRFASVSRFHDYLKRLPKFDVRLGWLAARWDQSGNRTFQQKQVDMLLGLDIALLSAKQQITHMALISGDSDLTPAVDVARQEGVVVWLFHGSTGADGQESTVARTLLDHADMRHEIDQDFMNRVRRGRIT